MTERKRLEELERQAAEERYQSRMSRRMGRNKEQMQADRAEAYEHMRLAKKHGERGASHDVASASADI